MKALIDRRGRPYLSADGWEMAHAGLLTKLWRDWDDLSSAASLRRHLGDSSFVAVDVETYGGGCCVPREIRFAFIRTCPSKQPQQPTSPARPVPLDRFAAAHGIITRCVRLQPLASEERRRGRGGNGAGRRFTDTEYVGFADLDVAVYRVLADFRALANGSGQKKKKKLVLLGYPAGADEEFRLTLSSFHGLARYFGAYADLRVAALYAATRTGGIAGGRPREPTVLEAAAALGFAFDSVGHAGRKNLVNPHNGAVHAMAVLLGLVARMGSGSAPPQPQSQPQRLPELEFPDFGRVAEAARLRAERREERWLPESAATRPLEAFPYTAKIRVAAAMTVTVTVTKATPLPEPIDSGDGMRTHFRALGPVAVAARGGRRRRVGHNMWTTVTGATRGWLAFADEAALRRFVALIDGAEVCGRRLSAESLYEARVAEKLEREIGAVAGRGEQQGQDFKEHKYDRREGRTLREYEIERSLDDGFFSGLEVDVSRLELGE